MITSRTFLLFLLPLMQQFSVAASDTLALQPAVKRLIVLGDSVLKGSNDSIREKYNQTFSLALDSILHVAGGAELSFSQVKALSVATSSDKNVKALTWLVQLNRGAHYFYYGYILYKLDPKAAMKVVKLEHNSSLNREELEILKSDSASWPGCIYYDIHLEKYKKKNYYVLLGWAPQSNFITRKVIEPLVVSPTKLIIGAPVIKAGGKARTRLVFEYNAQATMSLKYNEKVKMIVMDHLSSSDPRPESKGMYALYGPDLSYDGLKFSKGNWLLMKDIDIRNN
ncbi:MAG: hypothetical protein IPN36_12170 [Bacteroidetes bacterium]|nr:hypothetical protein [Bacteroidota bacterium]